MYWFSCIENDAFIQFEINTYEDLGGCREVSKYFSLAWCKYNIG